MLRNERLAKTVVMPWEKGLAAKVFNPHHVSRDWPYQRITLGRTDFVQNVIQMQSTACSSNDKPIVKPVLPFALRKLRVTKIQTDPDVLRQRAINMWRLAIEDNLLATRVGLTLQQLCTDLSKEEDIQRTLLDVFAPKSTATLFKRGREILAYIRWFRDRDLVGSPLQFTEQPVYEYMDHLRASKAGPTRGNSFLQAVRFTVTLLGCHINSIDHVISARVKGASYNMYLKKRPLKQALPLSVQEVRALEDTVLYGSNHHDRLAAGFMLFCIMSSARVSDAQNITNLRIDEFETTCILECDTLRHKTAYTCEKKTTFLPYLCLGNIFRSESWAKAWLQMRQEAGLVAQDWALPAPDFNGTWLPRKTTTGEVTQWLRDIMLTSGLDEDRSNQLTSHGFKCTILSWAAKFGMDLQTRRVLGHHVDPEAKSALTYSRDALISAHIRVAEMLNVMSSNNFNPDISRAERIHKHFNPSTSESTPVESDTVCSTDNIDPEPVEQVTDESSSDDDLNHVDLAVNESSKLWTFLDDTNSVAPLSKSDVKYVQHIVSGCMHIEHPEMPGTLFCGRVVTFNYREALKHDPLSWTLCGQCKNAHQQ